MEKAAIKLDDNSLPEKVEKLRQDVSEVLLNSVNKPENHTSNLISKEKKRMKILKQVIKKDEVVVDKGIGFVTFLPQELKDKTYTTFQNVTSDTPNKTDTLEGSIQWKLLKLKKEIKLTRGKYFQIRPSGSVTPSAYLFIPD